MSVGSGVTDGKWETYVLIRGVVDCCHDAKCDVGVYIVVVVLG